jgi:hypothetical protein
MIIFVALNRNSEGIKIIKIMIIYITLRDECHDHGKNIAYILTNIKTEENFVSQRWIIERGFHASDEIRNIYIINNHTITIYGRN